MSPEFENDDGLSNQATLLTADVAAALRTAAMGNHLNGNVPRDSAQVQSIHQMFANVDGTA